MVTDLFGALLQELGPIINAADLHPDQNNSCRVRLKTGVEIQMELDRSARFLVVGTELGVPPVGKYRENLFREALKANDMPPPLHGILAYSKKSDNLILFEKINVTDLSGLKIAEEILPFAEKALVWSEAIKHNEVPALNQAYTPRSSGMFGLKP